MVDEGGFPVAAGGLGAIHGLGGAFGGVGVGRGPRE